MKSACPLLLVLIVLSWIGCSRSVEPPRVITSSLDKPLISLIETTRQAVVSAPESAMAWGRLGQAFHATEFVAEAQSCYQHAIQLDSRAPAWPHLLGVLQLQDQPEAAFANLARAADLAGVRTDASRVRLVQTLVERGRYDDALKHIDLLLVSEPVHAGARLQKARIQFIRGEIDAAADTIQPCLTNAFTRRPAALLFAQILHRNGEVEAAAQLTRGATAMPRPFDWPDPFVREMQSLRLDRQRLEDQVNGLLVAQRLPEAEVALDRLIAVFPDSPEGLLLLGRLRIQQRQCTEAENTLRRHLTLQPNSLNGTIQLGLALLCQERWQDTAVILRGAITLKPDFAQAHFNLGYALSRTGDSVAAILSFREALRCSPGNANAHTALAEELFKSGDPTSASAHVQRALELNPNDFKARVLRDRLSGKR